MASCTQMIDAVLVDKPVSVEWLDEVSAFIETEAYRE